MARYIVNGIARDNSGNVIASATVSVYLAATTTPANIYTAYAGGTAVNSVTSGTDGVFYFYIDTADYGSTQRFKIIISKTGFSSKTYDYINVLPPANTGGYDTLWVPANAMTPTTTYGAALGSYEYATNDINLDYLAFDSGAYEEQAEFSIAFPDNWDLGTVKVKFYWSSATGSSIGDNVSWGIQARALSNDDAIDTALGTAVTVSDALLATNGGDLQVTAATGALTIAGTPAMGDMVHFKVFRDTDGTDDMTEDAWLFGVLIQFSTSGDPSAW